MDLEEPDHDFDAAGIEDLLRERDPQRLRKLWSAADRVRQQRLGDGVHLRGLLEISNHCRRRCHYCGLHADNHAIHRYRMSADEILDSARECVAHGYGTIVIQAGEDPGLTVQAIAEVVRRIKHETPLAVTLSLGERGWRAFRTWRAAGADRYLLRFETSDESLFHRLHPPQRGCEPRDRLPMLRELRALGYELGSGFMVGLPGQTWSSLARDLSTCRDLDLDMIGIGPFIIDPGTELAREEAALRHAAGDQQVPADEITTCTAIALARLLCPDANIPATTALATLNRRSGRENGLRCGANVLMPNITPPAYRVHYTIYPDKACIDETALQCRDCMRGRIARIGRQVASGPGSSQRYLRKQWEGSLPP